jgi:hypothetical protein
MMSRTGTAWGALLSSLALWPLGHYWSTGGLILSSQTRTAETHVDHFFENTFEAARRTASSSSPGP